MIYPEVWISCVHVAFGFANKTRQKRRKTFFERRRKKTKDVYHERDNPIYVTLVGVFSLAGTWLNWGLFNLLLIDIVIYVYVFMVRYKSTSLLFFWSRIRESFCKGLSRHEKSFSRMSRMFFWSFFVLLWLHFAFWHLARENEREEREGGIECVCVYVYVKVVLYGTGWTYSWADVTPLLSHPSPWVMPFVVVVLPFFSTPGSIQRESLSLYFFFVCVMCHYVGRSCLVPGLTWISALHYSSFFLCMCACRVLCGWLGCFKECREVSLSTLLPFLAKH